MTDTPDLTALRFEALQILAHLVSGDKFNVPVRGELRQPHLIANPVLAYVDALVRATETRIGERLDALREGSLRRDHQVDDRVDAVCKRLDALEGELSLLANPQAVATLARARQEAARPERVGRGSFAEAVAEGRTDGQKLAALAIKVLSGIDAPESPPAPVEAEPAPFIKELQSLINRHSRENGSNTPDFVLATHMAECLAAFDRSTRAREAFYGVKHVPGASPAPSVPVAALEKVLHDFDNHSWRDDRELANRLRRLIAEAR